MLLSEVYIYKTEKEKFLNSNETTETMNDDDWEEIDTQ